MQNPCGGEKKKEDEKKKSEHSQTLSLVSKEAITVATNTMATLTLPLPSLPEGWAADKDFKAVGTLSSAVERSIEPVGPHFLAHARRARHKRTFSEDDRIQAQEKAKNVEDVDDGEISEPEDPMMLQREAKDWKVSFWILIRLGDMTMADHSLCIVPRSLQGPWYLQVPLQGHGGAD